MDKKLKVKLLRENAKLPVRASAGAAAYDLCAAIEQDITILPGQYVNIPTGIAIEFGDSSLVALVFSRSGHGVKNGVSLTNSVGVVDSDYRGEISAGLINHGDQPFTVSCGDRIAQLMITYSLPFDIEVCDALSDTARGTSGFGSTGTK